MNMDFGVYYTLQCHSMRESRILAIGNVLFLSFLVIGFFFCRLFIMGYFFWVLLSFLLPFCSNFLLDSFLALQSLSQWTLSEKYALGVPPPCTFGVQLLDTLSSSSASLSSANSL